MAEKNDGELQKPIDIIIEPTLAESEEPLDVQIDRELENLNSLISKLELEISNCLDTKEREEREIEKGEFLKKIGKLGKKSTESKLNKIIKLKKEIEGSIGNEIAVEERNKEELDNLILATNKCLEDLRKKYDQFASENNLNDSEKEQLNQIISEYQELIQGAVSENNKGKLEGIGYDIKADLENDIEIVEEEIEKNDGNEKTESGIFNREAIMKDFNSFFDKLRIKLVEFEGKCRDDNGKEACEKLGKNIRYWARKINDFESIKNPSHEDIEIIMQLHDEIEKKTEENWIKLYEDGKFELATRDDLERDREKAKNMEEKYAFSRKVADIARVKTDNYEKLNGSTEKEGDENFKNEIKRILKDNLVVHGKLRKDKKTGEFYVEKKPDLDCKASLELIKMAKIKIDNKKIHYEREGGSVLGRINIDTGGMDGLVVLEDGTVFIDHHGKESGNRTSATEKTLEVLISAGLLKDYKYLRNLVSFVNKVDNFDYPKSYFENYFTESWKTLYGLSSMLDGHELSRFFECEDNDGKPLDPGEPMDDELMRKIGVIRTIKDKKGKEKVIDKPASRKEWVLEAQEELKKMEKEGFIIESERYGKICLNIDGRMKCGTDAAKAFGCDTYLAWNNNSNNFFISSLNRKKLEDEFADGLSVRGTMWINPLDNERKITLEEILNKMTDGKFTPSEEVKKALEEKVIEIKKEETESEVVEAKEESAESVLTDLNHEEIGHPVTVGEEEPPVVEEFEIEDNGELSAEEREELKSIVAEKITEIEKDLERIENEFGDFLENHGRGAAEFEFKHYIQKEIITLGDNLKKLKDVRINNHITHASSEEILKLIHESDDLIRVSSKDEWEQELEKFKEGSEKEEFEFSEAQKEKISIVAELFRKNKFIERLKNESEWNGYREVDKEVMIELLTKAQLRQAMAKMKKVFDTEEIIEKTVDEVFNILKTEN